jgi:hypothetical protein
LQIKLQENNFFKSLLTSPAYRQAGSAKGRENTSSFVIFFLSKTGKRGIEGDFNGLRVTLHHERLLRK